MNLRKVEVIAIEFALQLAFALTFYKLEGKTVERLLVNLNYARMMYEYIYVAITRVQHRDHFRMIKFLNNHSHLINKQVDEYTLYFLRCYDDNGQWNADTAKNIRDKVKMKNAKKVKGTLQHSPVIIAIRLEEL